MEEEGASAGFGDAEAACGTPLSAALTSFALLLELGSVLLSLYRSFFFLMGGGRHCVAVM